MPRINHNKKRPTSSNNKKKKRKSKQVLKGGHTNQTITNINNCNAHEILSQADLAFDTSNLESALQLYTQAQLILQQTIQTQQQQQQQQQQQKELVIEQDNTKQQEEMISNILTLSKVYCKIGEMKSSLQQHHDLNINNNNSYYNDKGYNEFQNGIQLLSNEHEQTYLLPTTATTTTTSQSTPSLEHLMLQAQWKELRANLYLYLGQLSSDNDALNNFNHAVNDLKNCLVLLEQMHSFIRGTGSTITLDSTNNNTINQNNIEISIIETTKQLIGAYCSIAELYLTDLCYESNAEQECEHTLKLALELDKKQQQQQLQVLQNMDYNDTNNNNNDLLTISSPDAVQAMANLRLCQNRCLDAIPHILDAYSRMKVGCEAMADLVGLGRESNSNNEQKLLTTGNNDDRLAKELDEETLKAANRLPGFEFRCQTAKILLECAATLEQQQQSTNNAVVVDDDDDGGGGEMNMDQVGQSIISVEKREEQRMYCIEAAIQTLGSLMAENDEVIETWYLLGCAFQSKSSDNNLDAARYYFETTLEMLMRTKDEIEQCSDMHNMLNNEEFNPLTDIMEKIDDVEKKLKEVEERNSTIDKMDED